ncbi:uncharacterized protein LOC119174109 isoform X3 [Rhipicephalus microplus]|uniref:uncharacterized protein LOC119174109 isoform X3 n=1 Tax=Rhipicephalus microplus TaxID=6941 RepID=UPI003F6A9DF4
MGGHKQPAGTSLFINFLIAITACTGQKLQAIESNGVFFSGLPRPPSETNAITAKGGGDIFGNTLGRGLQEKFTTANPPKTGSTPFDFRFNSAKPDNRFVMIPASAPRTPSNFVTRPTFFTDSALTTPAPRLFVPTTPGLVPPPPPPPPRPPPFRPPTFAQTTSQQTTQRPPTFGPVTQRPTTQRPVTEGFETQRPTTQRPTTQRPTTESITTPRPTTQRLTTQRPTSQRQTTQKSTTQKATTSRPGTLMLTTPRLMTPRPSVPFPTTPRPTTQRPTTQRPVTRSPTAPPTPAPSLKPTNLQELPPTPRLAFQPGTAQNAVFTGRQPTPIFPIIPSSPAQRPPSSVATTRSPTPFFSIDTTPPPPGNEPSPVSPVDAGNADSLGTPCMIPERSFNAINTARPFVPVPTTTRRRIFVPASALSSGTLPTTTTLRPPTRLASPAPTGTSFSFCDQRQCVKMCRERFGDRLNSSSCLANACKCEVTQTCSPSLCLEMCRKNNPGQEVLSAGCQGDNCRCSLNQPCEPSECRRRCLLAHGDKLISADCAVRNACQCVHS